MLDLMHRLYDLFWPTEKCMTDAQAEEAVSHVRQLRTIHLRSNEEKAIDEICEQVGGASE